MRRLWSLVFLWAAAAFAVQGEAPLTVGYQKTFHLIVPWATAAYSLDSSVADASAADSSVQIVGKGPGSTTIMVVTPAGVETLAVVVPVPPPSLPPGFEPPERQNAAETGVYELRY